MTTIEIQIEEKEKILKGLEKFMKNYLSLKRLRIVSWLSCAIIKLLDSNLNKPSL
jgi:hypothetical protein